MIKAIRLDERGAVTASMEVDDFVIETLYAGIAMMLSDAASPHASAHPGPADGPTQLTQPS
jgi:hypothetical protein